MRSGNTSAIATAIPSTNMVRSPYPSAAHQGADTLRSDAMTADAMADEVLYESRDAVARVTINRPERRNAMSYGVMQGLRDAMATARADDEVRVVVLTGAGDRAFCAGADLTGIAANEGAAAAHEGRGLLADLFRDMWSLGKPIVARGPWLRARGRLRTRVRVRSGRRGRRRGVRHTRDQRRPVALHDHGPAAALDGAEDRTGPDDDRPPRRRGRGRAPRVRPTRRSGRRARRDGRRARRASSRRSRR